MPDERTRQSVDQVNAERARLIAECEAVKIDLPAIHRALEAETARRDETERRAAKHGGIPLSILRQLLAPCPRCQFFGRLGLVDPLSIGDDDEVWVARCMRCTLRVEAPSPQQAFDTWNRREADQLSLL